MSLKGIYKDNWESEVKIIFEKKQSWQNLTIW